jgi:signal transduction histidine kinase
MTAKRDQRGLEVRPGVGGGVDRPSHLSYVAHEVRNPLSTALWTAELLARLGPAERGGARGEKLAAICLRSVNRVRLLVEDHLLCERLDAGSYPIRAEAVKLAELLQGLQARWPAGGGGLTLPLDSALVAQADRSLLERALEGLLAAAAGPEEAAVRVDASRRGERLELRVTGGPIGSLADPERGSPSEQRGRALSLAMARRVAAAIGGALEVEGGAYLLSIPSA